MKPKRISLRSFLPTAAVLAAGMCMTPFAAQAGPGHSAVTADYRLSAAVPASDTAVSERPYDAFGFGPTGGATYQTVGDLERWVNRAAQYYGQYQGQRKSNRRYNNNNSRSYRGYYPNDPDDRNNPRHPDYIGPPGSYRSYRSSPYRGHEYHPNDPDDRNNPNHPDYIGPPGSSPYRYWRR